MNRLTLHSAEEAAQRAMDDLLVPAPPEGHYVTGKPGHILLYVRNRLKWRSRSLSVSWSPGTQHTVTVGPGQTLYVGPLGGSVAAAGIRVEVTYPRAKGLRVCAFVPPMEGQRIRTTTPVQWIGRPR